MKSFFALAAAILSFNAFATSLDLTPVAASVTMGDHGIREAALLADGRLQIVRLDGTVATRDLSEPAFDYVLDNVKRLSGAEVKTTTHEVICYMMVSNPGASLFVADYDYDTESFSARRLVLTPQHCAMATTTAPVSAEDRATAQALRDQLVTLALISI